MTTNEFTFNTQNGDVSAVSHVQASYLCRCSCGCEYSITLPWPENLQVNTKKLVINNANCPNCQAALELPEGSYGVDDYKLVRL